MYRKSVASTNLESIGYENGILEIEFHGGRIYQYSGVPEYEYVRLINAPSHGTYFVTNIKNVYECTRLY